MSVDSDQILIIIISHIKFFGNLFAVTYLFRAASDKMIWSNLGGAYQGTIGLTWWQPCPTVCWAQLRLSLTSVSVAAECYDSYKRLVANRTSVSIVCTPWNHLISITISDRVAGLMSVWGCFLMPAPMSTSRWNLCQWYCPDWTHAFNNN